MIALIAATALESRLLRSEFDVAEPLPGQFPLFRGQVGGQQVLLAHSGIGKANAAACASSLLCRFQPQILINFGCGGAYVGCGLKNGDLALADSESLVDEGSDSPEGFLDLEQLGFPLLRIEDEAIFNRLSLDAELQSRISRLLQRWSADKRMHFATGPFVTVSSCTGSDEQGQLRQRQTGGICENMEGAAIALVARRFSCAFAEVRGISNLAARRDTAQWDLPTACKIVQQAMLHLLQNWPRS